MSFRISWPPIAVGVALLALWETAITAFAVPVYVLPGPLAIGSALVENWADLLVGLTVTLQVTLTALLLAAMSGVAIAVLLAQSQRLEQALFPYAVILQVTPIVTVAPFVIIWVSDVFTVLLILAWMAAVFPVLSNTLTGLKSVDVNLRELFRLYGATRWQTAVRLSLPSALPYFLAGLRISGGLALIGTVVAEMVAGTAGTQSGLASRLVEASYRLELPRALACFVLLGAAGVGIYMGLDWFSNRVLRRWHDSART